MKISDVRKHIKKICWINGSIKIEANMKITGKASQKFEFFVRLIEVYPNWWQQDSDFSRFYITLRKIIFYIFSTKKMTQEELEDFKQLTENFFNLYTKFVAPTPKAHFIGHYLCMIKYYDQLEHFSTAKFERKHATLKNLVRTCKNFKNIAFTLSDRHELEQAGHSFIEEKILPNYLPPNEYPFKLNSNILRQINETEFIQAIDFFRKDKKIYVRGRKILISHEDLISEVIGTSEEEISVPLSEMSHQNSYEFRFSGKRYVNIITKY